MNIFYTDPNPSKCALQHCDLHMNKMLIEYAQLLSTAHRVLDGTEYKELSKANRSIKRWKLANPIYEHFLYKATHVNHPSAIWVRDSGNHYAWLYTVWYELNKMYTAKTGKVHGTYFLNDYLEYTPQNSSENEFVPPYVAIDKNQYPDIHEQLTDNIITTVKAYQLYMNRKFQEWQTRNDKRKLWPVWSVSRQPHWCHF